MIGRVGRLRVTLGLTRDRPLVFLAEATSVYTGLRDHALFFPAPSPSLPVLLGQIQAATAAQQLVGNVRDAGAGRDATFRVVRTSLESARMMVQALCDASPEQGPELIAAASMKSGGYGVWDKPLLGLKNGPGEGVVSLEAYARLLDGTRRKRMFNWRCTIDGGVSFVLWTNPRTLDGPGTRSSAGRGVALWPPGENPGPPPPCCPRSSSGRSSGHGPSHG
jgi:hypothetical protein